MITNNLKVMDLFCGAGGFSKGFEQAGFKIIAGIDNKELVKETYIRNHKQAKFYQYDISKDILDIKTDIIIGSPPCQGFSSARGNWKYNEEQKKRNNLALDFARWVIELNPTVALLENVAGFMTHHTKIREKVIDLLSEQYNINESILQGSDYGVPQNRKRYFLLAIAKEFEIKPSFPIPNGYSNRFNLTDAFNGLPKPKIKESKKVINSSINCELKGRENSYQKLITLKNVRITTVHIAKEPNDIYRTFIDLIPQGKAYRSDRIGSKYISIWEIAGKYEMKFGEVLLTPEEQTILEEVAYKRIDSDIKTRKGKNQEGYVPISHLKNHSEITIKKLVEDKWLKLDSKSRAVDFTAKAGHWRRYYRPNLSKLSPTILTEFSGARMFIHPTENRGFSLREGARIQAFPDDFVFNGSFTSISRQIGNAVPPLFARTLAAHLLNILN